MSKLCCCKSLRGSTKLRVACEPICWGMLKAETLLSACREKGEEAAASAGLGVGSEQQEEGRKERRVWQMLLFSRSGDILHLIRRKGRNLRNASRTQQPTTHTASQPSRYRASHLIVHRIMVQSAYWSNFKPEPDPLL